MDVGENLVSRGNQPLGFVDVVAARNDEMEGWARRMLRQIDATRRIGKPSFVVTNDRIAWAVADRNKRQDDR